MTVDPTFTDGARPTIRIERTYPHPIDRVWRAVTTPEHLGQWFPSPVVLDLRPGGAMRFAAFEEHEEGGTGVIEAVDPPTKLEFSWGTDRLTFLLAAAGDESTTFTLVHTFDDRVGAPSFATGWEVCLGGLRAVLADEPLPAPDRGIARHEELVHTFGLDRPEVTKQDDGGWTVRIERQLTCTPEVARDLWSDIRSEGGPGDHITLEFIDGTGHGARIRFSVVGSDPAQLDEAVGMWIDGAIGHLAAEGAEWAKAQPVEA